MTPPSIRAALTMIFLVGLVCAGLVLVLHAMLPFGTLRHFYDSLAPDSEAAFFSTGLHDAMKLRAGLPGLLCLVSGLCGILARRHLYRCISTFFDTDVADFLTRARASLQNAFASSSTLFLGAIALVASATALRLYFIEQPLRYDEATTFLYFASQPLHRALSTIYEATNHPLNTALMHVSWRIFGDDLWALRLPVFLAGAVTVPLTHWAAVVTFGHRAGLIAGAVVGVSWIAIQYSVQARGYALGTMFVAVLYGLSPIIARTDNRVAWMLFALAAALAQFAVPSMAFGIAGATLWLLFLILRESRPLPERLPRIAAFSALSVAMTLVLYAPIWMMHGISSLSSYRGDTRQTLAAITHETPPALIAVSDLLTLDWPPILQALLAVILVAGLVLNARAAVLALVSIGGGFALVALVGAHPPDRIWAFLVVPLGMIAGAGASRLIEYLTTNYRFTEVASAVVAAILIASVASRFLASDSIAHAGPGTLVRPEGNAFIGPAEVAKLLAPRLKPGDRILTEMPGFPIEYYLMRHNVCADSFVDPNADRAVTGSSVYNRICRPDDDGKCRIALRGQPSGGPCALEMATVYMVTEAEAEQAAARLPGWGFSPAAAPDRGPALTVLGQVGPWIVYQKARQ